MEYIVGRPTTVELDINSPDLDINMHTHTDAEAYPLVLADTRKWLDETGFTDVTFVIKKVFGPGGGAAVIDFTAPTYERLRELVTLYDQGNGEVDYILGLED